MFRAKAGMLALAASLAAASATAQAGQADLILVGAESPDSGSRAANRLKLWLSRVSGSKRSDAPRRSSRPDGPDRRASSIFADGP